MASSHGIIINQYYAGNEIFRANAWVQELQERAKPHITTYSGVDSHQTNGLAEIRTRDIQDVVRDMIIHYQQKFL